MLRTVPNNIFLSERMVQPLISWQPAPVSSSERVSCGERWWWVIVNLSSFFFFSLSQVFWRTSNFSTGSRVLSSFPNCANLNAPLPLVFRSVFQPLFYDWKPPVRFVSWNTPESSRRQSAFSVPESGLVCHGVVCVSGVWKQGMNLAECHKIKKKLCVPFSPERLGTTCECTRVLAQCAPGSPS